MPSATDTASSQTELREITLMPTSRILIAGSIVLSTVLIWGCGNSSSTAGAGGVGGTTTSTSVSGSSTGAQPTTSVTVTASTGAFHCFMESGSSGTGIPNDCMTYCDLMEHGCTGLNGQLASDKQYASNAECMTACAGFAPGTPYQPCGNTLACRLYWANAACNDTVHPSLDNKYCPFAGPNSPTEACMGYPCPL